MWNSKVKFTFLSFMILTLMTGCLKPGQKSAEDLEKSGNEASSFQVSNLYPAALASKTDSTWPPISRART